MSEILWLPNLILFDDYSRSNTEYVDALHSKFVEDFLSGNKLEILGKPVYVSNKTVDFDGKNERFWHIITDPHKPEYSNLKEKRAERISWIRAIIENHEDDLVLKFKRTKNSETRLHLFVPNCEYMIILTEQKKAYYLVTAFHIEYTYKMRGYQKEYEKYKL